MSTHHYVMAVAPERCICTVHSERCTFIRLGGNALALSGHVWHTTVKENEFNLIGDSAIITVGDFKLNDGVSSDKYPMGTRIVQNHFHEIGGGLSSFDTPTECLFLIMGVAPAAARSHRKADCSFIFCDFVPHNLRGKRKIL